MNASRSGFSIVGRILPESFSGLARDAVTALVAVPLLLLLVLVVAQYGWQTAESIVDDSLFSLWGIAALLALLLGALFFYLVRRDRPFNSYIFLVCSLGASTVIYYAYIASVQVAWISDFETMWEHALVMTSHADYTVRSIYDQRALPVLVPLVLMFGPDTAVVPLVNLAMLLAIQLVGYDIARRASGHRAAQGFAVLWIGAMEPIMALPITSHDIWGLFFLVIFFWAYSVTRNRVANGEAGAPRAKWVAVVCGVIGMALALVLLELQRELVPLVILACVLASLLWVLGTAETRRRTRPALLVALAALALYGAMAFGLKHTGHMLTSEQGQRLAQIRTGAYGSALFNGRYRHGMQIWMTFLMDLPPQIRRDTVYALPLSDLALRPQERIGNIFERAAPQARLGGQWAFYQAEAVAASPRLLPFTRAYNVCYSAVIALLALFAVVPWARRRDSFDMSLQLGFLGALVGTLLLVGESQPRYVFPVWFVLPQLVAGHFARNEKQRGNTLFAVWGWDLTRGAVLLVAAFFAFSLVTRVVYGESQGRIITGWQPRLLGARALEPARWFEVSQIAMKQQDIGGKQTVSFGNLGLSLKIPVPVSADGGTAVSKKICAKGDRRSLAFYYRMPYDKVRSKSSFALVTSIDGRQVHSIELPDAKPISYVKIPNILPEGACGTLEISLRSRKELNSSSWIRASQVSLFFVRLVR